ncbi:metal-dependent hydrolase [Salinigranum marinum]|uniref:metal-dependent hydrolase n=1 Tax=Salinigranum marinum TaxID=1515595 RepID=UPI002989B886|nr:metal-dependent hydrolase [Salinigranum marinum]
MFPLGHALFGYLLYVPFALLTRYRLPYRGTLVALLVGTQFPDVVDKPLAFVGVLPSGRALAHSVFFAAGLFAVLWVAARRYDRPHRPHLAAAFGFGHVSHLLGDAVNPVAAGRIGELTFLLWPVFPATTYPSDDIAPWVRIVRYYASPELTPGLVLIPIAVIVFVAIEIRRRRLPT